MTPSQEYPRSQEGIGSCVLSEDLRGRLVRLLRDLERSLEGAGTGECSFCRGTGIGEPHHDPDCELAACLRELERAG